MPQKPSLLSQISDFLNLYTLIFGAIMMVLGIQYFILGIYFQAYSISCYSLPLLVLGAALVASMLEDKVYHRVFYRPAYPTYYSQQGYLPSTGPSYAQPSSPRTYQQSPQTVPQPSQQQAPPQPTSQYPQSSQQQAPPQPTSQYPQSSQQQAPPQPTPQYPQPSQESHTSPDGTFPQPALAEVPPQSSDTGEGFQPTLPDSEAVPIPPTEATIDSSPAHDQSPLLQATGSSESIESADAVPPPSQEAVPTIASPAPVSPQPSTQYSAPQPSIPPPQPAQQQPPVYSPPYYSGYGQGYGTPYNSQPYVTYVQYFRETLSIPRIRTLLYVFLISIIGGSLVLIIGPPFEFLFPVFFIIAFTFPSFIWISYVYHKDVLEPESKHGIFLALTWGMFSTLFVIGPNGIAGNYNLAFAAVIVAPLIEELFKPLGLTRVKSEMNSELDGLVYGVTCGMGFAIIENFTYEFEFIFSGDEAIVIWTLGSFIRGIGSTIVHAVGAGLIGFTYARLCIARQNRNMGVGNLKNPLYNLSLPLAYILAVVLHAGWNGSATITEFVSGNFGISASIIGHILVFTASFHIIKSLANEGIRRDVERHRGRQYAVPVKPDR